MKKFFLALMAVAAIALTSCKHETCTLQVVNHYSKSAIVLFSHDEKCRAIEDAEIAVHCKTMNVWDKKGVNIKDMHAILYICENEEQDSNGSLEAFKFQMSTPLNKYAGMGVVTIDVSEKGYLDVHASSF